MLLTTLAILICGGIPLGAYLLGKDDPAPVIRPDAGPTSGPGTPPASPAPIGTGTPAPQSSTDVRFVEVRQCVRNEGGNDDPKLSIVPCGPETYEVLARFDGATTGKEDARSKCSAVQGYTDWYFFDSPLDVLDYVLCLKSR